ncbi:hypothetical protein [Massilia aquatica]|uniref:hypothetical protein n=1 Tax=Massilia aquatica TaxID=2609000 RepID=UPI001E5D0A20|nr:hypothetical protein [Massilia aquatica]
MTDSNALNQKARCLDRQFTEVCAYLRQLQQDGLGLQLLLLFAGALLLPTDALLRHLERIEGESARRCDLLRRRGRSRHEQQCGMHEGTQLESAGQETE